MLKYDSDGEERAFFVTHFVHSTYLELCKWCFIIPEGIEKGEPGSNLELYNRVRKTDNHLAWIWA